MQQIADEIQELQYRVKSPPLTDLGPGTPNEDYPSTGKDWELYRAGLRGQPVDILCPECGGLEYLLDPITRKPMQCPTCQEDARRDWLMKHCGLEGAELTCQLSDWKPGNWDDGKLVEQRQQARGAMQQVIERRTGLLTFWGDFGAGKTMALQIIANELRHQLVEAYYVPLAFVLDHLRSLFVQKSEWSNYWQRLLDVPVLCLDEVTRFYETDWAVERLWMLVDKRYARRASHLTVFATNNDPRQRLPVTEAIGYLYSRMREGQMIELRGDMRGADR